jgi:hypothetical protein
MELMELVGNGDCLTSIHLGVYIEMVETKHYKIDREILLSLGVAEDIVAQATVEKPIRPHIRLMQFRNKKQESTKAN